MPYQTDIVVCDDIRHESTGKLLLIGVYMHRLVTNDAPAVFALAFFMRIRGVPRGDHRLQFICKFNDQQIAMLEGEVSQREEDNTIFVPMPQVALRIDHGGILSFSGELSGEPLEIIDRLEIEVGTSQQAPT